MSESEKEPVAWDKLHKEQVELVERYMTNALSHTLGEPVNPEVLRRAIAESLERLETGLIGPLANPDVRAAIGDIIALDWIGIPEAFDAKAIMARIPTESLDWLMERWVSDTSAGGRLLWLEHAKRHGHLNDWTFTRRDNSHADITLDLKRPLKYTTMTFAVDPKEGADGTR